MAAIATGFAHGANDNEGMEALQGTRGVAGLNQGKYRCFAFNKIVARPAEVVALSTDEHADDTLSL